MRSPTTKNFVFDRRHSSIARLGGHIHEKSPIPKPILRKTPPRDASKKKTVHFLDQDELVSPHSAFIASDAGYPFTGATIPYPYRASLPVVVPSTSWPFAYEKLPHTTLQTFKFPFLAPLTRTDLRWDLVRPLSSSKINVWLNCNRFLDGPALGPEVRSAKIHFREPRLSLLEQLWGPVIVRTRDPGQPITVRHLLDEIFDYFQHLVVDAHYVAAMVVVRWEDVVGSWRRRNFINHDAGYKRPLYRRDPFIRRVDFLVGHSLFRKLRLLSISGQSSDLLLSIG